MMLPLALCSIVAVTIIIDRLFFFRGLRAENRAEEVIGLVVGACHSMGQTGPGDANVQRMVAVVCDGLRVAG